MWPQTSQNGASPISSERWTLITSIVVGTLGAIFGFWLGQTWQQKREDTLR